MSDSTYWVYILASKPYGTLYIGVTNSLLDRVASRRVAAHRDGTGSQFASRYNVTMLVHYEPFADIEDAIQREKSLKRYARPWKINLIERDNPRWVSCAAGAAGQPRHLSKLKNGSSGQARG